jgi:hypothetical protein
MEKVRLEYDEVGDILYIERVAPYAQQESDLVGEDIVGRFNPKTGKLESLEILWFVQRLKRDKVLDLPVDALTLTS